MAEFSSEGTYILANIALPDEISTNKKTLYISRNFENIPYFPFRHK